MPRPTKGSPEAKAWATKMKAARTAAQQVNQQIQERPPTTDNADYTELSARVKELEQLLKQTATVSQQPNLVPTVTSRGLVGTLERYILTPNYYPDPTPRLSQEPRLARFAFGDNYELNWHVDVSEYDTIDGVHTKEPRFTLKLIVKIYDDITGELTNKRYTILKGIFHEDPAAAVMIANQNGVTVDESNEKDFLDEMRYLRFRDWLLEAFYPTPPPPNENKREMVVGNKLVEVYEVSSEKSESMAGFFSQGPKKL